MVEHAGQEHNEDTVNPQQPADKNSSAEHEPRQDDHAVDAAEETAEERPKVDVEELEKAQAELESWKDRYLRAAAEMENAQRRWSKERSDLRKFGVEDLLRDLLPVLDSFDQAMASLTEGEAQAAMREGIELVKRQLLDRLGKHGLVPVEAKGQPFDPNLHQGIQRIEAEDVETEMVQDEFQKGYTLHGRLVRPSMVSVKVPMAKKGSSGDEA